MYSLQQHRNHLYFNDKFSLFSSEKELFEVKIKNMPIKLESCSFCLCFTETMLFLVYEIDAIQLYQL